VEAPVSGSIVLAGILLKLGAYGLVVFLPFIYFFCNLFCDFFFILGLWGGLICFFICFFQVDLKKLVAFISISHIGIVLRCIFTFNFISYVGIIFILICHGLRSSGIFYGLNCFYERAFSRSLIIIKGNNLFLITLSF
jgi:NADH-ubiquinone oxidoreductase chain 4